MLIFPDSLHKSRLLSVEEKPFKRVTKRLLASESIIGGPISLPLTPPPDASQADEHANTQDQKCQKQNEERRQFREDVTLDFAAFESSIARIQFIFTSNEKERERYAAEKLKIIQTAQAVRESTAQLHSQLEEARKTLAVRKTWDDLTEKITANRMLRPREDQEANLARLNAEIAELEKESSDYARTWAERREQFGRIVKEGEELRRLIRDEKEEVERLEGMEDGEEGEEDEEGEVATQKGADSAAATPRPFGGADTPMGTASQDDEPGNQSGSVHLTVTNGHASLGGTPLRSQSPHSVQTPGKEDEPEAGEDTMMTEQGEIEEGEEGELLKDLPADASQVGSATMSASSDMSPTPGGETPRSNAVGLEEKMDMT